MSSRTITIEATGQRSAPPKHAVIEALVRGDGDSAAHARSDVHKQATEIRESITATPSEQIRTIDVRIEDTAELFEPGTDAAYQATRRVEIECPPETAEAVVTEVTDAGATVRTVEFDLTQDRHEQLRKTALTDAMEQARAIAERMATVEGLSISGVREIQTKDEQDDLGSIMDDALGSGDETNVQPAPITVSSGVEVVYDIADAER